MSTSEDTIDTLSRGAAVAAAFNSWFGTERATGRILVALYQAQEPITAADLATYCQVSRSSVVQHHIPHLRDALESEGVDTEAGGYLLTDTGRAECQAVLRRMSDELRSAA